MTRPQPDHATRAPLDRDSLSTIDLATGEPRPLSDDEYTEIARALTPIYEGGGRGPKSWTAARFGPYDPTAERGTNPVPNRLPPEWSAQGAAEREDAHEADLERLHVEEPPRPLGVPRKLTEVEAAGDDAAGQPRHHVHAALLGRAPSAAAVQGRTTGHGDYTIPALPDRSETFVGASRGEQTRDVYEVAEPAAGELEIEDEEFEP